MKNNCRLKKPVNTGPDKCLNVQIFTCATSFNRIVQVLLKGSVMLAGSGVNERRFRESFFRFKICPDLRKRYLIYYKRLNAISTRNGLRSLIG